MSCYIKATNIPYLHCRNGIYYYRNQSTWKSLKTRCKKEAFLKFCNLFSSTSGESQSVKECKKQPTFRNLKQLVQAYMKENGGRWCIRENRRINNCLKILPVGEITKEVAIDLKKSLLEAKTVTTFNRYLKE